MEFEQIGDGHWRLPECALSSVTEFKETLSTSRYIHTLHLAFLWVGLPFKKKTKEKRPGIQQGLVQPISYTSSDIPFRSNIPTCLLNIIYVIPDTFVIFWTISFFRTRSSYQPNKNKLKIFFPLFFLLFWLHFSLMLHVICSNWTRCL